MSHHTKHPGTQTTTYQAVATSERPCVVHVNAPDVAEPTHEAIARRAYDIYVKTGRKQGQCKQNWQQAEQSLLEQPQPAQKAAPVGVAAALAAAIR
jgi:hypothetical protein